jgi:hypothetical protein
VGALALACAIAGTAAGDPKKDKAAVAKLEELYAPIGKLAGAERVNRACTDAAKLQEADNAFSDEKAPAGASVDNAGWAKRARDVEGSMESLVAVCKAPDRKRKLINTVETADQVVAALDADLHQLFDAAKKRVLPAALGTFRTTLAATKVPSKAFCPQLKKLAKQVSGFAKPPKGVDAAGWQPAYDAVKASVDGLQCAKSAEPDEVNASGLEELRGKLDKLVALVPAT